MSPLRTCRVAFYLDFKKPILSVTKVTVWNDIKGYFWTLNETVEFSNLI